MTWRLFSTLMRLSFSRFTDRAIGVISAAWGLAAERGHEVVTPEHVLGGLASTRYPKTLDRLRDLGIDLRDCASELAEMTGPVDSGNKSRRISLGPDVRSLLEDARSRARGLGHRHVGTEHLLLALLERSECRPAAFLRGRGADVDAIRRVNAHQ